MAAFTSTIQFAKRSLDEARRLVTAWASVVTDGEGKPVVDSQGDIIPVEELQNAVLEMASGGMDGKVGVNHEVEGVGSILESMVITKEKREKAGLGDGPEGWLVTFKIHDDGVWERIRSGELLELSIAGEAERVEI